MRINSIKCPECGDIIYSRARHDLRHCSCGKCFIDGGFDYIRISGEGAILGISEIQTTPKELFDDWNLKKDKHGLIKTTSKDWKQSNLLKVNEDTKPKKVKSINEYEKEWYNKQSLKSKIVYKFWSIIYYFQIKLVMFLYNLADKINRNEND